MNYEELYSQLTATEKDLKDSVSAAARFFKAIQKNTDSGNLTEMKKNLQQMAEAAEKIAASVKSLSEETEAFDTRAYFKDGDFTKQFLEACEKDGLDVKGEKGVYEVFPYKVRIYGDEEHAEEVWINRKKQPSFRPLAVSKVLKAGREKLLKVNFNSDAFLKELADAYEATCLREGNRIGKTITLTKIYKTLTPMARARKEYDMQAFAFDLARLYEKGPDAWVTKDGCRYDFGTSRDGKNAIRVLSSSGVETYIQTFKQMETGEA